MQDFTQMSPNERAAKQNNLKFVHLNGKIGIISNGAGAGMAMMDHIKSIGGTVSDFADIGHVSRSNLLTTI